MIAARSAALQPLICDDGLFSPVVWHSQHQQPNAAISFSAAAAVMSAAASQQQQVYDDPAASAGAGGDMDPALAEQMAREAERAADAGAAQALSEAQQASQAAQARERAEEASAGSQPQQQYDLGQEFAQYAPNQSGSASDRTFLTGVDHSSQSNLHQHAQQQQSQSQSQYQSQQQQQQSQQQPDHLDPSMRMSDEELIGHVEQQMLEYERTAQYLEAEKARQHLEALKKRFASRRRDDLERVQSDDVKVFFAMVAQHQSNFDATWSKKTLEHKLRADELIDACKWKHEDQQRELYETLRKKRMPKFSVELLNMRKRQVMLARSKNYISAEKVKRKADVLEGIEIERIRECAKEENQLRFQALLKKQEWDRSQLAAKLRLEKQCLLEAKAQDFLRLRKRLRNAEQELKKTHVRQQLLAEKKILPLYSYNAQEALAAPADGKAAQQAPKGAATARERGSVLRNTGMQRMMSGSGGGAATSSGASSSRTGPLKSARELAARSASTRAAQTSSSYESQQSANQNQRTGQSIVSSGSGRTHREEKEPHGGGASMGY